MQFWRCFSWDGKSKNEFCPGAPLYAPFALQGAGRYDIVNSTGVLYASLHKESALAEYLKVFRDRTDGITKNNLTTGGGLSKALVLFDLKNENIADLRELEQLKKHNILPAQVSTQERKVSQTIARNLFENHMDGLLYWSPLKSEWTNAALFFSRVKDKLKIETIELVTIQMPEFQSAAKFLGVRIER